MKKLSCRFLFILFAFIATSGLRSQVSLAGQWAFKLDPQDQGLANEWFGHPLGDTINDLFGSFEQRGFGIKNLFRIFGNHVQVKVGNNTGKLQQAIIQSITCVIPIGGTSIDIRFKAKSPNRDEFTPVLHTVRLLLKTGRYKDTGIISRATGNGIPQWTV